MDTNYSASTSTRKPLDWQKDPSRLSTPFVQFWRGGSMLTAQMPLETARQRVRDGHCFVICSQAVGALLGGNYDS